MKSIIHQGHSGLENSKKHARQALFWPLINNEIENMIKNCPTCLTVRKRQRCEPVIKNPVPQEPWTKLTADLFRLNGHYYLLVVDYNSKFVVVENLNNSQSLIVINKCKKIFLQYGTPKELITDNGPEFTSHHFKKFTKRWDFKHQTISSHYHQSTGLVEPSIQTVKRTLKKAKCDQQDKYLALLFSYSQPNENEISPAQKLFNCQLRTNLPSVKPLLPQNSFVTETPRLHKTTNFLPKTSQENTVRICTDEQNLWDKKQPTAIIHVLKENGNVIIRSRRHLISTNEKFMEKFSYDNIILPTTKLPESIVPPQTANFPKPVTSSTTINPSKPTAPNKTKVTQSGHVSKKTNRYIEQCWQLMKNSIL